MKVDRHRPVFAALDLEYLGSRIEQYRQEAAADAASREVDRETVGLFRKYNLPLPDRLAKSTWKQYAA